MFDVPGAKKYDFSRFDQIITAGFMFLLCYLGCKNTHYDQFYRVGQLPENRNEMAPLKALMFYNDNNKIMLNLTLSAVFQITMTNFVESLAITIQNHDLIVKFNKNLFLNFVYDGKQYCSFYILSPIFGDVNISIDYINTPLNKKRMQIKNIALFYPSLSLIAHQDDYFHFSNVILSQNALYVFLILKTHVINGGVRFENKRFLPLIIKGSKANEYCGVNKKCEIVREIFHLFSVPQKEDMSPLDIFISILNPIADFLKVEPRSKVGVITEKDFILSDYLNYLGDVRIVKPEDSLDFKELRLRKRTSHNFLTFAERFRPANQSINILFVDIKNDQITSKSQEISNVICRTCSHKVLSHANTKEVDIISNISGAKYLFVEKSQAHLMFALPKNANIYIVGKSFTTEDNWMYEMARHSMVNLKSIVTDDGDIRSITSQLLEINTVNEE